jgi:hypothetical protein
MLTLQKRSSAASETPTVLLSGDLARLSTRALRHSRYGQPGSTVW